MKNLNTKKLNQAIETTPDSQKFGRKVFIVAAWARYNQIEKISLDEFKAALVNMNREGSIRLARADLVTVMDQFLVDNSETCHLTATFHFIVP